MTESLIWAMEFRSLDGDHKWAIRFSRLLYAENQTHWWARAAVDEVGDDQRPSITELIVLVGRILKAMDPEEATCPGQISPVCWPNPQKQDPVSTRLTCEFRHCLSSSTRKAGHASFGRTLMAYSMSNCRRL